MKYAEIKKLFAAGQIKTAAILAQSGNYVIAIKLNESDEWRELVKERQGVRFFSTLDAAWRSAQEIGFCSITIQKK